MAQSLTLHQDRTVPSLKDCKRSKKCLTTSLVSGGAGSPWQGGRRRPAGLLVKMVLVYLCLWQVGSVLTCGNNPLRRFRPLSRMLGKDISTLLGVLRTSNPSLYLQIEDEWRTYAECVRQVDTGYFKRSGEPQAPPPALEVAAGEGGVGDGGDTPEGWGMSQRRESKEGGKKVGQTEAMLIGLLVRALAESPDEKKGEKYTFLKPDCCGDLA